jgi:hypothetical protein
MAITLKKKINPSQATLSQMMTQVKALHSPTATGKPAVTRV